MTITRGLITVTGTGVAFGATGALIGFLLGRYAPDVYRVAFSGDDIPPFDPPVLGLALGLVQGVMVGISVGLIVVLAARNVHPSQSGPRRAFCHV